MSTCNCSNALCARAGMCLGAGRMIVVGTDAGRLGLLLALSQLAIRGTGDEILALPTPEPKAPEPLTFEIKRLAYDEADLNSRSPSPSRFLPGDPEPWKRHGRRKF